MEARVFTSRGHSNMNFEGRVQENSHSEGKVGNCPIIMETLLQLARNKVSLHHINFQRAGAENSLTPQFLLLNDCTCTATMTVVRT